MVSTVVKTYSIVLKEDMMSIKTDCKLWDSVLSNSDFNAKAICQKYSANIIANLNGKSCICTASIQQREKVADIIIKLFSVTNKLWQQLVLHKTLHITRIMIVH